MTDSAPESDKTDILINAGDQSPIAGVVEELRALRKAFDSKIRYDEVREGMIRSMGEELAQHRQNFHQTLLRPVLLDLISLYDDFTKILDPSSIPPAMAEDLRFFRDSVEQVLARNGVQKYSVEGDAVDRSRQRVLNTVDTPDACLHRKVAHRLRPGFAWDEKVLRPEWVSTYRHVADVPEDPPAPGTEDLGTEHPDTAEHPEEGVPR
jgi:molecular chaperone GrpE (heat shock protein)